MIGRGLGGTGGWASATWDLVAEEALHLRAMVVASNGPTFARKIRSVVIDRWADRGSEYDAGVSTSREPVVLLAFANTDEARPLRNLAREEREIRAALEPRVASNELAEPQTLWNATVDGVVGELRKERFRGRIRVFHFGGHADGAALMLADHEGAPATGHAAGLADYLGQQEGLVLVVLNGCSTRAQVDRLRRAGVAAVVATSKAIMDDVAADFAAKLYAELAVRPLRAAFDAATATVRGKKGEDPRELVREDAVDQAAWDEPWPWVLSCAASHEGWRLVGDDVVATVADAAVSVHELIDELARVVHDSGTASVLLSRIGFPRGQLPRFDTPLVFWSLVVDALRGGVIAGGVPALVDAVAGMFPGNPSFARHRGQRRA
jgi:hypothetical protein